MTALELNQLVREIGEEVERRLGHAPSAANRHSCACDTPAPARPSTNGRAVSGVTPSHQVVASSINLALLRPEATSQEIQRLCGEARRYGFASVCVQPSRVALAVRELRGTNIQVAAVIGYPQGATLTAVKLAEAEQVVKLGARELEMVIHPGALNSGDLDGVYTEIRLAAGYARAAGAALKVLAEMAVLGEEQKVIACALARLGGAGGVKTSAGGGAAASAGDVALAHRIIGGELGIEAAGDIDSYFRFQEMIAAGATRISTSEGAAIVNQAANS